jgi:lipopolysaccharide cholinephosphotransferase
MNEYSRSFDERFPDNRLEGETELRQGQLVMLRLMKIFAAVCEELGLTYWMDGGTLLGAVRHGGFIPWDDDVDVAMPRDQYEEFLRKAPELLPYDVYLDTSLEFAKLRDRYSTRISLEPEKPRDSIYIDIFPLKRFPRMRKVLARVRMLIPPYTIPGVPKDGTLAYRTYRVGVRLGAIFMRVTGLMFVVRFLSLFGDRHYWANDLTRTWHHHFNDEWLFPQRRMRFEDALFFAPGNAHAFLSYQYGDYMKPPPENRRNHHNLGTILPTTPCDWPEALRWEERAEARVRAAQKNNEKED